MKIRVQGSDQIRSQMTLISIGEVTIPKNYLYLLINRSLSIDKITNKKEQMPRAPYKDSKKIVLFFFYFFQLPYSPAFQWTLKVAFCQKVRLINQIVKYICKITILNLKLSSITVECCISVSVLNLIHQESNHPIMFIFFCY